MRRWLFIISASLLALTLLAGVVVYARAGEWLRVAIVEHTRKSLDTGVSIATASVALRGHAITLSDCAIDNPPGGSPGKLLTLGSVNIDLPWSQLRARPVHIDAIHFASPRLLLERVGTKWNVQQLSHPTAHPLRICIDHVTVSDAVVSMHPHLPGLADEITVNIPNFAMDHVGDGDGVTIGQALTLITKHMMSDAAQKGLFAQQMQQQFDPARIGRSLLGGLTGLPFSARAP